MQEKAQQKHSRADEVREQGAREVRERRAMLDWSLSGTGGNILAAGLGHKSKETKCRGSTQKTDYTLPASQVQWAREKGACTLVAI
mmetsp:Transcript_6802/g.16330  ORF Transcript_6802/g.16330 Transcript_6802/m.16330 type:complete len:86 (-) Transcript_6802:77-334(-)|eukprot:17438-Pelagomonas_calceolata.AAC.3